MKTDREKLEELYNSGDISKDDLKFGRIISFGKYKGSFIYLLLVQHPLYMDWLINNTSFSLTETEKWWKAKVDLDLELMRASNLIYGLSSLTYPSSIITPNENNPHVIIE